MRKSINEAEDGDGEEQPSEKSVVSSFLRRKRGRRPIPESIPREEIILDLPDSEKTCACGQTLSYIGDDVSEELELIPQKIMVHRYIQRKYACKSCEGLGDESRPAVRTALRHRLLPGTIAGEGLLAYILTSKFCDALPFYRQEKMFDRIGIDLTRGTMCSWAIRVAEELAIVSEILWDEIRSGSSLGADETTLQVICEAGRKADQKSYMWVLRGGRADRPVILFEYRSSRRLLGACTPALCHPEQWAGQLPTPGNYGRDSPFTLSMANWRSTTI
ncbi:MAG: transposase [Leptospirales bacterium]|nr:transposase [Leptospirales bacterium]